MFAPAFDVIGKSHHIRVVLLAKSSCAPWHIAEAWRDLTPFPQCPAWRSNVESYINRFHPKYVLPLGGIGIAPPGSVEVGGGATASQIEAGILALKASLKNSNSKILLLSNIPWMSLSVIPADPNICLARSSTQILNCSALRTSAVFNSQTTPAIRSAAIAGHIPYIDTSALSCSVYRCFSVVGDQVVYVDAYHFQRSFVEWTAPVLYSMMEKYL
jgi:SGNH domain (fused to AT3 domains)